MAFIRLNGLRLMERQENRATKARSCHLFCEVYSLSIITILSPIIWCSILVNLATNCSVLRNDKNLDDIVIEPYDGLVISPDPVIQIRRDQFTCGQEMGRTKPLLGVCLGHQCIGQAWG